MLVLYRKNIRKKIAANRKGGKPKGWRKNKSEGGEIGETHKT